MVPRGLSTRIHPFIPVPVPKSVAHSSLQGWQASSNPTIAFRISNFFAFVEKYVICLLIAAILADKPVLFIAPEGPSCSDL